MKRLCICLLAVSALSLSIALYNGEQRPALAEEPHRDGSPPKGKIEAGKAPAGEQPIKQTDPKYLVQLVLTEDTRRASEAKSDLAEMGSKAVPALMVAMEKEGSRSTKSMRLAHILGDIGYPDALPSIPTILSALEKIAKELEAEKDEGQLTNKEGFFRVYAENLGILHAREAVPILSRVAGSDAFRYDPRVAAVKALGRIADPKAVDALLKISETTMKEETGDAATLRNAYNLQKAAENALFDIANTVCKAAGKDWHVGLLIYKPVKAWWKEYGDLCIAEADKLFAERKFKHTRSSPRARQKAWMEKEGLVYLDYEVTLDNEARQEIQHARERGPAPNVPKGFFDLLFIGREEERHPLEVGANRITLKPGPYEAWLIYKAEKAIYPVYLRRVATTQVEEDAPPLRMAVQHPLWLGEAERKAHFKELERALLVMNVNVSQEAMEKILALKRLPIEKKEWFSLAVVDAKTTKVMEKIEIANGKQELPPPLPYGEYEIWLHVSRFSREPIDQQVRKLATVHLKADTEPVTVEVPWPPEPTLEKSVSSK